MAVGEADRAGLLEQRELGHVPAGATPCDRAVGIDLGAFELTRATRDELDHGRVVDRRHGIGQAGETGHPARRRGRRAARVGLLVLGARLAQLDAHVDQPRRQARAARVDHDGVLERRGVQVRTDVGDAPALDHHAAARIQAACRIEQARADDRLAFHHAAARSSLVSVSRQAMRTATPSST